MDYLDMTWADWNRLMAGPDVPKQSVSEWRKNWDAVSEKRAAQNRQKKARDAALFAPRNRRA